MSRSGYSRGEPKRLLEKAASYMPEGAVMPREQAQALVEKVVKLSKADEVSVNLNSGYQADLRFAANQMSTAGGVINSQLVVQSTFGKKHAAAVTNDLSDESLRRAVEQSEALAKLSPDDPETMPGLGPQKYLPVNGYFESTADLSPTDRARAALTALEPARKAGDLKAAGFIIVNAGANALGKLSRNPVAVEPGRYTVILEPQAVGDLVQLMGFSLAARSADEGRSAFSKQGGGNKIGEQIMDKRVTIFSDPQDPQLLAQPYDGQGLPLARQVWIENGVLKQLFYSRFWAQKQGKQPTGFPTEFSLRACGICGRWIRERSFSRD